MPEYKIPLEELVARFTQVGRGPSNPPGGLYHDQLSCVHFDKPMLGDDAF